MFIHSHHPHASYMTNSGTVKKLCEIVSPKFDVEKIVSFGICHVEQMSCEETSCWVWTFCHHKGWDEAKSYAAKFKEQSVLGCHLKHVTDFDLEEALEIKDKFHRKELLDAISYMFSGSLVPESKVNSEAQPSAWTHVFPSNIVHHDRSLEGSLYSTPFTHSSVASHSESGSSILSSGPESYYNSSNAASQIGSYGTGMAQCVQTDSDWVSVSSQAGSINVQGLCPHWNEGMLGMYWLPAPSSEPVSTGSNEHKKLGLELNRVPEIPCSKIRSWFLSFDSSVQVKPMKNEKGKYIILFKDANSARKALCEFRSKRYNIRYQYPDKPSPSNPVKFRVMAPLLLVREGKSLKNRVVGMVGTVVNRPIVWVNQIKHVVVKQEKILRARIMRPTEDGKYWKNWGWVTRFVGEGSMRLLQEADE